MKELVAIVVMGVLAFSAFAFEVSQVFRPERFTRGNTNLVPVQPIDEAAWIWTEKPIRVFLSIV